MSSTFILAKTNSSMSDLQGNINDALTDVRIGALAGVYLDFGNERNRIALAYKAAPEGVVPVGGLNYNDFEVIAKANSSLSTVTENLTADIASEQALEDHLLPTSLAAQHGDGKHRAVVGLTPAAINNGDFSLVYAVTGFSGENIDDLVSVFNEWALDNPNYDVIDQSYYYGNSKNRAMVLYSYAKQ